MKVGAGDHIKVRKVTNLSLNLWQKAKSHGMSYLHCPCNVKPTDVCLVLATFGKGGLVCQCNNFKVIVHIKDIIKIEVEE